MSELEQTVYEAVILAWAEEAAPGPTTHDTPNWPVRSQPHVQGDMMIGADDPQKVVTP